MTTGRGERHRRRQLGELVTSHYSIPVPPALSSTICEIASNRPLPHSFLTYLRKESTKIGAKKVTFRTRRGILPFYSILKVFEAFLGLDFFQKDFKNLVLEAEHFLGILFTCFVVITKQMKDSMQKHVSQLHLVSQSMFLGLLL